MFPVRTRVMLVAVLTTAIVGVGAYIFIRQRDDVAAAIPKSEIQPDNECEKESEVIIVVDDARSVERQEGAYGSCHVSYLAVVQFPAHGAIDNISARLSVLGWTALQYDWLNPGIESSHVRGWAEYEDRTTPSTRIVHQWTAQWSDSSGDLVDYTMKYVYQGDCV